jgi:beta-lactamase regulating signal transducer with metallopeptidase domain/Tol biopolymer transport system component
MEAVMTYSQVFFGWLLQTTLIASMVICLILLIQKLLGGRLGPRWSYALWLVLLMRMILPWSPSSRVSLSNLIPSWQRQTQSQQSPSTIEVQKISPHEQVAEAPETITSRKAESEIITQDQAASRLRMVSNAEVQSRPRLVLLRRILPTLWLAGAIVIGVYLLVSDLALWRIVKRDRPLLNQSMLELFEECKAQMSVQSLVVVVPSDQVRSPGLFGFVRPRLLLPRQMLDSATAEELRYVFLHELAHLRRHDIYLGWLTSLLQVLHWFNPLVWFAFYRMRADRELACDALVLTRTGQDKSQEYGGAIVELVRRFSRSRPLPAMAGIIESKSQLKKRIAMIAKFKKNSYQWSPLGIILVIILACISLPDAKYTKASGISAAKPSAMAVRQVWNDAADPQFMGAPSPDGKYLSYVDWETGDLAVHDLATGKNHRLTNKRRSKGFVYNSVFSPDSRQVAYFRWSQEKGSELHIVGLDGSGPRVVNQDEETSIYSRGIYPTGWTPDGKHILALGRKEDRSLEILLVPVAGGPVRILKTLGKKLSGGRRVPGLCLSPDGRYVAYTFLLNEESMNRDISVIATDGSHEIPLEKHPADDFVLGWTPDSKQVVFASDRTGSMGIWAVEVAEGKMEGTPQLLKPEVGQFYPLGLTQSGSFYYGVYSESCNVYTATYDSQKGDITAKPVIAVHRYEGSNSAPDWSPDGRYLACVSASPGASPVFLIHSVKSGEVRKLSPDLKTFNLNSLRWSADGRFLLGAGKTKDVFWGVLKIDIETGAVTPIVEGPGILGPNWAADGKAVFYVCNLKTNGGIIRHDFTTGEKKELYSAPGFIGALALSPDGRQLAFHDIQGGALKVLPTTGGESRELVKVEGKITIAWAPNGRQLVYGSCGLGEGSGHLWRISAGGGEPQKLNLEMPYLDHVRFHPDGRQIAFTGKVGKDKCEVWVMENFLPEAMGK